MLLCYFRLRIPNTHFQREFFTKILYNLFLLVLVICLMHACTTCGSRAIRDPTELTLRTVTAFGDSTKKTIHDKLRIKYYGRQWIFLKCYADEFARVIEVHAVRRTGDTHPIYCTGLCTFLNHSLQVCPPKHDHLSRIYR
jgi:hypothetical protein